MPADSEAALSRSLLRRLAGSLRIVLLGSAIFIGLGAFLVFLIGRAADERSRALVAEEFDRSTLAIADALRPVLRVATPGDAAIIAEAMAPYAAPDRALHLFFTPEEGRASGVFFIASAPAQVPAQTEGQAEHVVSSGALGDFSAACSPPRAQATFPTDAHWAVVPLASASGCWRLVANRPAAYAAVPFLALPPIRSTALAAAAAALLMIAAAVLAMTQTRRLREIGDFGHAFAEITAVADPELLPLPANDESELAPPADDAPQASVQILDLNRSAFDLSAAVRAYVDTARARLGADAGHLRAEIEDGLFIDGRADFVNAIMEELVDPALRAPLGGEPLAITLAAETADGRGKAALTVTTPRGPGGDAGGRLSLIKQFIVALGATTTTEDWVGGSESVQLRFPLARAPQIAGTGAG